jgi:hypothetical protein
MWLCLIDLFLQATNLNGIVFIRAARRVNFMINERVTRDSRGMSSLAQSTSFEVKVLD